MHTWQERRKMHHADIRLDRAHPAIVSWLANIHASIWYLDPIDVNANLNSTIIPNIISDPVRFPRIKRVISAFLDLCL